jgi:aryl-alcohol dehydrogenase-like predicted oxidoreductase
MKTRPLGSTGLEVSCIGLGGMPLSIQGRPEEKQSVRVIHAALDAGMTWIDTADVYCRDDDDLGHNERLVATALSQIGERASRVLVATKGGLERPGGDWTVNGRPEHLRKACERSLEALGVEAIPLYQVHAPDPEVAWSDSVGEASRLQEEGKILHVGISNVDAAQLAEAREVCAIASVQNRCNPFDRQSFEGGVVQACEEGGVAFLPHSPVGGHRGRERTPDDAALNAVGARHGATPYEVCIAWLLAKSPAMLPIPGASRVQSAISSAKAAELELTAEDLAELDAAFPV